MISQLLNSFLRWFVTLFLLWTFPTVCCDRGGAGSHLWGSSLISRPGGGAGGGSSGCDSLGMPNSKTGGVLWAEPVSESSWLLKVVCRSVSNSPLQLLVCSENNDDKMRINQHGAAEFACFLFSSKDQHHTRNEANMLIPPPPFLSFIYPGWCLGI